MRKPLQILILILIFNVNSYSQERASSGNNEGYPAEQTSFFFKRQEFCKLYNAQANEIKASQIYTETNEWSSLFMSNEDFEINSWEGTLATISTDKGGDYLDVVIESEIDGYHITFQSTRLLGSGGIAKGTAVYNQIAELSEGQNVAFTGKFKDEGGKLAENSITESGSVCQPTFEIEFSDVQPSLKTEVHTAGGFIGGFVEGFSFVFTIIKYVLIGAVVLFIINIVRGLTKSNQV